MPKPIFTGAEVSELTSLAQETARAMDKFYGALSRASDRMGLEWEPEERCVGEILADLCADPDAITCDVVVENFSNPDDWEYSVDHPEAHKS